MSAATEKAHDKAEAKAEAKAAKEAEPTKEEKEAAAKAAALSEAPVNALDAELHRRVLALLETCSDDEIKAELAKRKK